MHFWLGVENFAKIECAKLCINHYTLLTGPNNSGKTMLMQLIEGVGARVLELIDRDMAVMLMEREKYVISGQSAARLAAYINEKLHMQKEAIVREIFGREIPIGRLYIAFTIEENCVYEIYSGEDIKSIREYLNHDVLIALVEELNMPARGKKFILLKYNTESRTAESVSMKTVATNSRAALVRTALDGILKSGGLFLPDSRVGLFTDSFGKEAFGWLPRSVRGYLHFLQDYARSEETAQKYEEELRMLEDLLLEGRIGINNRRELFYQPKSGKAVPLKLSSPGVQSMMAFVLALTGKNRYDRLFLDEADIGLDEDKLFSLACLLNRLSNKGMRLVISTHGSGFAEKWNYLYRLALQAQRRPEAGFLRRLGLEKEDLPKPEEVSVYRMEIQSNGRSIVLEVPKSQRAGYRFPGSKEKELPGLGKSVGIKAGIGVFLAAAVFFGVAFGRNETGQTFENRLAKGISPPKIQNEDILYVGIHKPLSQIMAGEKIEKPLLSEGAVYSFLQGPRSWESGIAWSGEWCYFNEQRNFFGNFGCGLCCMANVYDTLSPYEVSPWDMLGYAKETANYTPSYGTGAIGWEMMKKVLRQCGMECGLYNKPGTYEAFQEEIKRGCTAVVLVCSSNDDTYWTKTAGHYVNLWLYDEESDTVFLAEPGSPERNRGRIPLRYVYNALKTASEYQYLLVEGYSEEQNQWKGNGIDESWNRP